MSCRDGVPDAEATLCAFLKECGGDLDKFDYSLLRLEYDLHIGDGWFVVDAISFEKFKNEVEQQKRCRLCGTKDFPYFIPNDNEVCILCPTSNQNGEQSLMTTPEAARYRRMSGS